MKFLPHRRFATFVVALSAVTLPGATDFNHVGSAMIKLLQDSHYESMGFGAEINRRILTVYLDDLDPERLYFTQGDVNEFEKKFVQGTSQEFDLLLLRGQGMKPANEIYTRYLTRIGERSAFIKQMTKGAKLLLTEGETAPMTRKGASWPEGLLDANNLWYRRIADELLTEELRREKIDGNREDLPGPQLPSTQKRLTPRETIQTKYARLEQVSRAAGEEVIAGQFLSAVARAHDPHSEYLSVKDTEKFDRDMRNELTGIGAELESLPNGTTRITGLFVGGPAHKGGQLQLNDRILQVSPQNNGKFRDVTFLPVQSVIKLILGKAKTSVALTVVNPDDPFGERVVVIERDTISVKSASASAQIILKSAPDRPTLKIGWIRVPSFYLDVDSDPSVFRDIERLVVRMNREEVDGIAIDLRNNPGGDLPEAPKIAGLFLPRGPIVQRRDRDGLVRPMNSERTKPLFAGPLVVVTDRLSASSSEILAAALQDYNRALIIGETQTFGKGTVQEKIGVASFFLSSQDPDRAGELLTTVEKFYRVTGSSTQVKGVIPDIIVPSLNDAIEVGELHLPLALPYDIIPAARGFRPLNRAKLHPDKVVAASRQRIEESVDFDYLVVDTDRLRREERLNARPLNRETRSKIEVEAEARQALRNEERRLRFATVEEEDRTNLQIFRLNLDDLSRKKLVPVDPQRDEAKTMLRAPKLGLSSNEVVPWPSGIDPLKRESLAVLADLIIAENPPPVVVVEEPEVAPNEREDARPEIEEQQEPDSTEEATEEVPEIAEPAVEDEASESVPSE